jgi:peptidoglycan/xylan/chitin deacetylase (PgdA/CDA1 family)
MLNKQSLAAILFRTGTLQALRPVLRDRVVVLNYHRIRPDDPDFQTPFLDEVYGPTASQFDEQMSWLKRHTRLLNEAEMIECLQARRGPGEMSVLVTFDDGQCDNYTLAYPILKAHRVPAIFFVASGLIESRRLGWWDQLAYIIKRTAKRQIVFDGETFEMRQNRLDAISRLGLIVIERMSDPDRTPVEELAGLCEVELPDRRQQDAELMTWEQLREVRHHDIAVGSHTHTHLVLSRISPQRQREELMLSRAMIGERLGCAVRSIAYPNGLRQDFSQETQRLARELGYEIAFSHYSGYNRWPTMNPFDVRRTQPPYDDRIGAAAAAIAPEFFCVSGLSGLMNR